MLVHTVTFHSKSTLEISSKHQSEHRQTNRQAIDINQQTLTSMSCESSLNFLGPNTFTSLGLNPCQSLWQLPLATKLF